MDSFSCDVRVEEVHPQDFGAVAILGAVEGGGIDIGLANFQIAVEITEDAAEIVKPGATLVLTLSKKES